MKPFVLHVRALDREMFSGSAVSLTVPVATGEAQILGDHEPFVGVLKEGTLVITHEGGKEEQLPIAGGVVEVVPGEVRVLARF